HEPVSWNDAADLGARVIKAVIDRWGPDAVGMKFFDHGGGGGGFENNWAVGRFFFTGVGTRAASIHNRPAYNSEVHAAGDAGVDWLVIGVGINIRHHPSQTRFPATSLASEGAGNVTVAGLLELLCQRFLAGLATWRNLGFAPIRGAWLRRAESLGGQLKVRLERETLHGIFKGLDADGALILNQDGRERRITAGDVFPAEPPAPPARSG
ncbi:MAG: biotin/lipoate--protein ligase family protein, partial [Rhodospirillales bacterium]|nr:biotin/lipoate--protein ligase family protein [Rhodospirillales bacterium]